jgi:hypothetical protein
MSEGENGPPPCMPPDWRAVYESALRSRDGLIESVRLSEDHIRDLDAEVRRWKARAEELEADLAHERAARAQERA